jgi:hypothetical protein
MSRRARTDRPMRPLQPAAPTGDARLQALVALLLIYLVIVVFFRELVFLGRVFTGSGDSLVARIFELWGREVRARGVFPLWNPFLFSGMPSFGSLQYTPGVYPVEWFKPVYRALFFNTGAHNILFHHLLGGFFMYLLLRDVRLRAPAALFGALVFFFSPQVIVLGPVAHGGKLFTIAWLPLVVLLARRLMDRPEVTNLALLALATGVQLLALHMQIAYYGMLAMGLIWAADAWQNRRERPLPGHLLRLGLLAAAVLLAVGLSAYLLGPVYEYSRWSIRGGAAVGGGVSWDYATSWSLHPFETLTLLVPSWFGFGGLTYWGWMPGTDHPYYMGLVPLLLAVVAVMLRRREPAVAALTLIGVFALLVAFGRWFPLLYGPLFKLLPFFGKFRVPALIMILVLLACAALAALGLEGLLHLEGEAREKWARRLQNGAFLFGVLCLIALLGRAALASAYTGAAVGRLVTNFGQQAAAVAGQAFDLFWADLLRVTAGAAASLGVLTLALRGRLAARAAVIAVIVLTGLDLWVVNARLVDTAPPATAVQSLEPNAITRFLQEQPGPFRILNAGLQVPGNYWMAQRIEDSEGYSPAKLRVYQEFLEAQNGRLTNRNGLAMVNCRYVVLPAQTEVAGFQKVFESEGVGVFLVPNVIGPAWLVGEAIRAGSEEAVLPALLGSFDVRRRALTTEVIGPLDAAAADSGQVRLLERSEHYLRYEVAAPGPVLLVASEVWYPAGWQASVDGEPVDIHRVDFLLRGVRVEPAPGGRARVVEMRFAPASVSTGRAISVGTLILSLGLLAAGWLRAGGRRRSGGVPGTPPGVGA